MQAISAKEKNKIKFNNADNADFTNTLRKRVDNYFKENNISKHGDTFNMYSKTFLLFCMYFIPFFMILTGYFSAWQMLGLVVIMGIGMAGIGCSVMHDGLHNAYSSSPFLNKIMGASLFLLGGYPFNWNIQHNVLHHTYTNVYEHDEDIETKVILRLSPNAPLKWYHKYQYIYAFLLYTLMTFSFLVKDFIKVFRYNEDDFYAKPQNGNKWKELFVLSVTKIAYLGCVIILPYYLLDLSLVQILLGFLIMHMVCGLILTVIFQLAHVVENTSHPMPNDEGNLENAWMIHQLYTTANFAKNNRLLNWYAGGLNYQVEHHLFPSICHIHYPKISNIVKNTAQEFGLPYQENQSFLGAIYSHFKMLKALGNGTAQG